MLDPSAYTDHFGKPWDDNKSRSQPDEKDPLAAVGQWKNSIDPVDLFLTEWLARIQINKLGLELSGKEVNQATFDEGIKELQVVPFAKALHKLVCFGEEVKNFRLIRLTHQTGTLQVSSTKMLSNTNLSVHETTSFFNIQNHHWWSRNYRS